MISHRGAINPGTVVSETGNVQAGATNRLGKIERFTEQRRWVYFEMLGVVVRNLSPVVDPEPPAIGPLR